MYILLMANRIREIREGIGLSQTQLAELCDTSMRMIQYLENGQRQLTQKWMERIAPHLGVRPVELLEDIDQKERDEFMEIMRTVDKDLQDEIKSLVTKIMEIRKKSG